MVAVASWALILSGIVAVALNGAALAVVTEGPRWVGVVGVAGGIAALASGVLLGRGRRAARWAFLAFGLLNMSMILIGIPDALQIPVVVVSEILAGILYVLVFRFISRHTSSTSPVNGVPTTNSHPEA